MMNITIEWVDEENAYIVYQDGEFIGDFAELLPAAEFALAVSNALGAVGVEIVAVEPKE